MTKIRQTKKNKELLIKELIKSKGIITEACNKSGVDRMTYYFWWRSDPEFKLKVDDIIERQIDFVENALLKRIDEGSDSSIQFYLKTKGSKRGYKEQININNHISFDFGISDEDENDPTIKIE